MDRKKIKQSITPFLITALIIVAIISIAWLYTLYIHRSTLRTSVSGVILRDVKKISNYIVKVDGRGGDSHTKIIDITFTKNCPDEEVKRTLFTIKDRFKTKKYLSHCNTLFVDRDHYYISVYSLGEDTHWLRFKVDMTKYKEKKYDEVVFDEEYSTNP